MNKCLVYFVMITSMNFIYGEVQDSLMIKKNMTPNCNKITNELIEIWTILDMVRSVTIEPQERVFFVHRIFKDIVSVLYDVAILSAYCLCCEEYYRQNVHEIMYLAEIIEHVSQAFDVVMSPFVCGEEKLVALMMIKIAETIHKLNVFF